MSINKALLRKYLRDQFPASIIGCTLGGYDMASKRRLFLPQNDKGWWYCDNCGALLNAQPGFTTESDEWTCAVCDEENDVSEKYLKRK